MSAYKLYSKLSDHETVLELWGGSTKHPDSKFFFSDFTPCCFIDPQEQIFPFTLICFHSGLVKFMKDIEGGNKKFPPFYKINLDKLYAGMI